MRILIWGIVGLSGLGFAVQAVGVHGSTDERAAIRHAVRAPFDDLRRRDARALCEDFAPSVAAHLTASSERCAAAVASLLGRRAIGPGHPAVGRPVRVADIDRRGRRASAEVLFEDSLQTAPRRLRLQMIGRHWRIATPASLRLRSDCGPVHGCVSMRLGS
jgi:hypothetical protein